MGLTTILFVILIIAIWGAILGILRKNKIATGISLAVCALVIIIALFLIFVLIPAM